MSSDKPYTIWSIGATSRIAIEMQRYWARDGASFFLFGRSLEKLNRVQQDLLCRGAVGAEIEKLGAPPEETAPFDILLISVGSLSEQSKWQVSSDYRLREWHANTMLIMDWVEWGARCVEAGLGGKIAVMSSVAADRAKKSNYGYGAAKAALDFYLSGVDHRLAPFGRVVVNLKPGPTNTPMTGAVKNRKLADPEAVARDFCRRMQRGQSTIYSPANWRYIMAIIRTCPRWLWNMTDF